MTAETIHLINVFLGTGAIILQVLTAIVLILLISNRKENRILDFIKNNFIPIGFFISLSAILVSTFYSEVLNYAPCLHCWIQRVFIFPQAFLFGVAWVRKDRNVFWYSWPLLLVGLVDSLYLIYLYYFNLGNEPCDATGVSCTLHYVSEFNDYISIPTFALTGFVALLTLLLVSYFYKKEY